MSVLGFFAAIYFILDKIFFGTDVAGWTSLMVIVLILAGFQMIMLGIIGEYLWRNLDETRRRPLFIIDEIYEAKDSNHE